MFTLKFKSIEFKFEKKMKMSVGNNCFVQNTNKTYNTQKKTKYDTHRHQYYDL